MNRILATKVATTVGAEVAALASVHADSVEDSAAGSEAFAGVEAEAKTDIVPDVVAAAAVRPEAFEEDADVAAGDKVSPWKPTVTATLEDQRLQQLPISFQRRIFKELGQISMLTFLKTD